MTNPVSKRQAIAILWHQGQVAWKLDECQKDLYNAYKNATHKTLVWCCSRRLGKSFCLCVIALERCLQKPGTVVKYIAPSQKHVKMIIRPLIKDILKDCPKEIRPEFKTADNIYRFPNGSEIQLAGTDNGHAESLRGGSSDICIVDEAGFCDDLEYIVQSILIPTTTTTRGKIILSSTPPKSADHQFVDYMEDAEAKGTLIKKTIYHGIGSRITMDIIEEIIEELGGINSPAFQREYLCQIIQDENKAIVPEFTPELQKEVIQAWDVPPYRDLYVSGDVGFKDFSVFLFAYYDFRAGKLIIEDELVMSGEKMTTEVLAAEIKRKEEKLWLNPITLEVQKPYLRICDNDLKLINDLHVLHRLDFLPTKKDDADAALNNLRIMIKEKRIMIHPRCTILITHLKYGKWDKNRRKYARSKDHGHYDGIDALKYLVRNVQFNKNPYPFLYGKGDGGGWFFPDGSRPVATEQLSKFASIFKPRR